MVEHILGGLYLLLMGGLAWLAAWGSSPENRGSAALLVLVGTISCGIGAVVLTGTT